MNKKIKFMVMVATIMVVALASSKSVSAATVAWNVWKSPGSTTINSCVVDMPLYKGDITFKVTSLNGECSYLVATAKSDNFSYYYVDNSLRCVKISVVGGEQVFNMKFTYSGNQQETMSIKCSLEHNASSDKYLSSVGTLFY